MMSLDQIESANREAALEAAVHERRPFLITRADKAAAIDGSFDHLKIPNLGNYVPPGWRRFSLSSRYARRGIARDLDAYFVDATGAGQPDEPALTLSQFAYELEVGKGYAIISTGQFQVHVGVYERCPTPVEEPDHAYVQAEDEGRCPHGMFYSGAGACPQCGGGATLE